MGATTDAMAAEADAASGSVILLLFSVTKLVCSAMKEVNSSLDVDSDFFFFT